MHRSLVLLAAGAALCAATILPVSAHRARDAAPAGNARSVSQGPRHKALARTVREREAALAAGGRLVAAYGDRELFEFERLPAGIPLRDDLNVLRFRAGAVDTSTGEPVDLAGRALEKHPAAVDDLAVVQFAGPSRDEWLEALERAGYERLRSIPETGVLVRARPGAMELETLPGVQWAGPYHAEWRVDPALVAAKGTLEASVEIVDGEEGRRTARRVERLVERVVTGPSRVLGAVLMRVVAPRATLLRIARMRHVLYVGRASEIRLLDERGGQIVAGAIAPETGGPVGPGYAAWLRARGLDGPLGFAVDVTDSGLDRGSLVDVPAELRDSQGASRVAYLNNFTTDVSADDRGGHGTINASLLAGAGTPGAVDPDGFSHGLGVAPVARVGATKLFNNLGYFDATATFSEMIAAAHRGGARISSNSWGSFANDYTIEAQEYDARARDARPDLPGEQPMLFVFAAGNFGTGGTVTSPGTAKNVISVGASETVRPGEEKDGCGAGPKAADRAVDVAYFSGSGPTYDGQARPDLVAPGTHMVGLASRADGFDGKGVCGLGGRGLYYPAGQSVYTWSSGTSHATPIVAGGAALVMHRLAREAGAEPSPALVKAWLLNTTRYLTGDRAGDDLPGAQQGWGMMDLGRALDDASRVTRDGDALQAPGDAATISCAVADASAPVRVTLVWSDPPGSSAFAPQVNDLDLEVTAGGVLYRGNNFRRDESQPGGDADARNTVEQVWLPAGVTGPIAVRVVASNVTGDGRPGDADSTDQDFALVVYNASETSAPVFVPEEISASGPGGALPNGGEAGVSVALRNVAAHGAGPVSCALASLTPGVTVEGGAVDAGPASPGALLRLPRPFAVRVSPSVACGTLARFELTVTAGGSTARLPVALRVGGVSAVTVFADGFEPGGGTWRVVSRKGKGRWELDGERVASGQAAWHAVPGTKLSDSWLESPSIAIPAEAVEARLTFWHTFSFEGGGYDGAVLEIQAEEEWADAGPLVVEGGYSGRISGDFYNPLGGRFGWVNGRLGDFTRVTVDLTSHRGREVRLRFRMATDVFYGGGGWFVDDVAVVIDAPACGP